MKQFFYITTRDGQIFEIENTGTRFQDCLELWQKGGLIILPSLGININGVDISKILNDEQYDNFVDSSQPKLFIKNGAWYDIKERSKVIRYEKWRELELEEKRKLKITGNTEKIMSGEEISNWFKNNKPEVIKEYENIIKSKKL